MMELSDEQRDKIAQRLTLHTDSSDCGQTLPLTRHALGLPAGTRSEQGERLEQLVHALSSERVIIPVVLNGGNSDNHVEFTRAEIPEGPALAVFTSTDELAAFDPQARPLPVSTRLAALSALVETRGLIVADPRGANIVIPRPACNSLSVGDRWLPAWKDRELAAGLLRIIMDEGVRCVVDVRIHHGGGSRVIVELSAAAGGDERAVRRELSRAINCIYGSDRLKAAADQIMIAPTWVHAV